MNVLEAIEKLEKSKEFNDWKKDNKKSYLAHSFRMLDEANKNLWQIGYFNPETNLISVFVVNGEITKNPDAEVFKEEKKLVNSLDKSKVKIFEDKALENANKILEEKYKGNNVFKTFMILQNLDKHGQIWNITFITDKFQSVNIKIDAENGECESHKVVDLIQK